MTMEQIGGYVISLPVVGAVVALYHKYVVNPMQNDKNEMKTDLADVVKATAINTTHLEWIRSTLDKQFNGKH